MLKKILLLLLFIAPSVLVAQSAELGMCFSVLCGAADTSIYNYDILN